ncbi:hypothetical protein ACM46_19335 [Chryseobacterium angstadtii]|uniref:DUF3667 domain-containing protein n=1 Tax=Chryseobacterium angstadtii TaxID=558151 RepID=A0A0J7HYH2_9FLAO|nr:DUF3667 domain-containing protein [Chryseobacterium angstadtii]KMQ59288.1 hypothetical protein ACM46_19335 [Chryseobacterium angstadtii]
MSHGKIREDKTCLNCGHQVEERFCPHCGQENVESRQPFHYLFTHFIEDFTHYDGQFWKTIQYLLIRPGKLTKEYLAGKRQLYVVPVKLYIFISFLTFFVPAILPHTEDSSPKEEKVEKAEKPKDNKEKVSEVLKGLNKEGFLSNKTAEKMKKAIDTLHIKDSLQAATDSDKSSDLMESTLDPNHSAILGAHNMKEYDSLQETDKKGLYILGRPFAEKIFKFREEGYTKEQIFAKYKETFIHTIPKALFFYLPVFAFFLWMFHNKKKWWYFDHGIFTLHYFSFLLLSTLIFILLVKLSDLLPDYSILSLLFFLLFTALFFYTSIYFFVAHHRVYESRKRTSILKGMILFIINYLGIMFMLMILMYISFMMMH